MDETRERELTPARGKHPKSAGPRTEVRLLARRAGKKTISCFDLVGLGWTCFNLPCLAVQRAKSGDQGQGGPEDGGAREGQGTGSIWCGLVREVGKSGSSFFTTTEHDSARFGTIQHDWR